MNLLVFLTSFSHRSDWGTFFFYLLVEIEKNRRNFTESGQWYGRDL